MTPPTLIDSFEQRRPDDRLALARLDDDGAPVCGVWGVFEDRAARFGLAPVLGLGSVDGAWWPRSFDAEAELALLLTALAPRIGQPTSVSLNATAWPKGPRQMRVAGHRVRLGWFVHIDPATITISRRYEDPVWLLVVPPETEAKLAWAAISRASSGTASGTPASMLSSTSEQRALDSAPGPQPRLRLL
jgi:hypothetical protein